MNQKQNPDLAEQLLESKSQRPKKHILKSPKKPGAKEKNKAATQRKAIDHDLGK